MFDFLRKKTDEKNLADEISLGINADSLAKYSDAGREFVKAYTGYDGETGQELKRSLLSINKQKLTDDKRQQAGFSAEVLDTARRNKDAILNDEDIRYIRVDDVAGRVNETAYDITAFDSMGKELTDRAAQMKFMKNELDDNGNYSINAKELTKVITGEVKINGERYCDKYPHGKFIVPKDSFDEVKIYLKERELSLKEQIVAAKKNGNVELQSELNKKLAYTQKVDKNLTSSKLTANEAINACTDPAKITGQEILSLGHDNGIQYAQTSAIINGAMAFARCTDKVIRGEMDAREAAAEVALETGKGALRGYVTGQANTALASVMRNSSKEALRELGKSSAPAQIVTFATSVFRIINDKLEGEITDEECFHNIAKSGIGVLGTSQAGIWGQAVGKKIGEKIGGALGGVMGPVGAVVASMIAGVVIDAAYNYTVQTLKAPQLARQERLIIEQQCDALHRELELYREEFRNTYIANTNQLVELFGTSLKGMALALKMNDADSFIGGANVITRTLGKKTQFETVDEFASFLDSDEVFNL